MQAATQEAEDQGGEEDPRSAVLRSELGQATGDKCGDGDNVIGVTIGMDTGERAEDQCQRYKQYGRDRRQDQAIFRGVSIPAVIEVSRFLRWRRRPRTYRNRRAPFPPSQETYLSTTER